MSYTSILADRYAHLYFRTIGSVFSGASQVRKDWELRYKVVRNHFFQSYKKKRLRLDFGNLWRCS